MLAIVIVTGEGRQYYTYFIAGEVEAETSPGTRPRKKHFVSVFLTKAGSLSGNRKEQTKVIFYLY